jgi:hypothetical protein
MLPDADGGTLPSGARLFPSVPPPAWIRHTQLHDVRL